MVTLKSLVDTYNYKVFTLEDENATFKGGYTGDLLSDVMGNGEEDTVFITIQAHKNSVAVASLLGIKAILLCNGREADNDMIEAAKKENIAILGTDEDQFTSSWKIATLLGLK
ncbi:MAG: iron-sulfur binding hydrogenase [Bacteroidia bacterium]|jgi:hypothetical protein|nr:iron-sulfur binding hydrogenase [Bacteroidia bacterium]